MNTSPLRIAIVGLGTVGSGVVELLSRDAELLAGRCGRPLQIMGVNARDKAKPRPIDLSGIEWVDNPLELAERDDVDVLVEAIGGSDGIAKQIVEKALFRGKSVVTANKALIAHHGIALATLAETHGGVLAYEAAVAGGIPIIKALRDGLAANRFTRIAGILNGTCNYILTQMWEHKRSFEDVLAEAQALGYAEADPSFDIDGIDTAHKLTLLASLAFGAAPSFEHVYIQGIRQVTLHDMQCARDLGYVVKLLGLASLGEHGIEARVHPALVPIASPLANVHDVYNAIAVEGSAVGRIFFEGRGAGALPTASSMVADIMDIARGVAYRPFTLPVGSLNTLPYAGMEYAKCSYYLRIHVSDRPGVLAELTGIFKEHGISVKTFQQHAHAPGQAVQLVMTTHETSEPAMMQSLAAIHALPFIHEPPYFIRIEEL